MPPPPIIALVKLTLSMLLLFRGINLILTAIVFNIAPTILEVSMVAGVLVRCVVSCLLPESMVMSISL